MLVLQHRLARLIGTGQHERIDVDDDLVPLARGAGIQIVVQGGLGDHPQRVRLKLGHAGSHHPGRLVLRLHVHPVARGREGLTDDRADFRGEPAADHEHAVDVLIDVERPALVSPGRIMILGVAIHAAPGPDQALDMGGGAGPRERQQARFRLRRSHARERADLRVGDLAVRERRADERQLGQRAGRANALIGGAEVHTDTPGQPFGAGLEAVAPAAAGVELADHVQQAGGRALRSHRARGHNLAAAHHGDARQRGAGVEDEDGVGHGGSI